jgi:exopolysaccharide biosynthesis polyprenyl glycosylphosphotransferase
VVAVGHAASVADLVTTLRRETHHGLAVVAACVAGLPGSGEVEDVPVVGELGSVATAVSTFGADTVAVLACPELSGARLRELAWQLEKTGTDLCVAPALLDVAGPRTTIRPVAGLPLLHVDHPELAGARQIIKGAFDRLAAAAALLVLGPLFLLISSAIKLTDPGPVLFRQVRVGKDGRPFTLYKFRTMVVDAERRKAQLSNRNEADGALFKIRDDPRLTRVGRTLRRFSLDELPQLVNVVRGEMSLVGPRPLPMRDYERLEEWHKKRYLVLPGITGLWQVSGRSDLDFDDLVRLDFLYLERWSMLLDLSILLKTIPAVLSRRGAY